MRKKGKTLILLFIICTLPILVSLDPITYNSSYHAKFTSPEGILFLSYTEKWDEEQLKDLYKELIKNQHGTEIEFLQEIRIMGGPSPSNSKITGIYQPLINSITLYNGNSNTDAKAYRDTLSHEYGHHFAYYYFPAHHFSFSKWAKLRGLTEDDIRWDSFWNYSISVHQWHPQEIFAEDYVLLFGSTNKAEIEDVYTNEAFYLRTQHENQEIPNVLENKKLHKYLEHKTGLKVNVNRILDSPILTDINENHLTYSITCRKDVAYRLNITLFEASEFGFEEVNEEELVEITSNHEQSEVIFKIENLMPLPPEGYMRVNMDILDLSTNIGFTTSDINIEIKDGKLSSYKLTEPE
ncbi:hypothetical protein ACLM5H_09250 [Fredinandcohnia humi]